MSILDLIAAGNFRALANCYADRYSETVDAASLRQSTGSSPIPTDLGTRVARALTLNRDKNDTGTAMVDPYTDDGEWPCGVWAHWHTESPWSADSFSFYMYSRYNFLLDIERNRSCNLETKSNTL